MRLEGKVAIVSGGGTGIGAASAKALAAEGVECSVLDLRSLAPLDVEAIADAEHRGSLNAVVAAILRPVVEHAPVQWLIDGGQGLAGLFD